MVKSRSSLVRLPFSHPNRVNRVLGCGVNVSTPAPMASLSLLSPDAQLTSETMLALILNRFEGMWETFVEGRGSWAPFEDAYLDAWMHSYVYVLPPHFPINKRYPLEISLSPWPLSLLSKYGSSA